MEIRDTRGIAEQESIILNPEQASVYKSLEDPCTLNTIMEKAGTSTGVSLPITQVQRILDDFIDGNIAINERKTYLGLALREGTHEPDIKKRWKS
jgi:GTP-sensing pleiotropic transcriptional regulator CodY